MMQDALSVTDLVRSPSAEWLMRVASEAKRAARANVMLCEMHPALQRPYILSAYRKNHDLWACFRSLFQLHNETVNVWLHCIGCALFAAQFGHVNDVASVACGNGHPCLERWPLYVFLVSALACLSLSAVYHLCGTANDRWYENLANLDYIGIVCLIVGSCTPVVHYGFGASFPWHRTLYLHVIAVLGVAIISCSFCSWYHRSLTLRLGLFFALALAGVLAILHALLLHDFSPATLSLLRGVLQMGMTYLAGVGIYVARLPECLGPSRVLDVIGSSHQWWHLAVVVAAMQHFHGVLQVWRSSAHELPVMLQPATAVDMYGASLA